MSSVAIIVPARDEAASIGPVLAELRAVAPTAEILVVIDDAADPTAAALKTLPADPLRRLIVANTSGPAAAAKAGAAACAVDVLVFSTADGSDDPTTVPALLAALSAGADLAVGDRRIGDGRRLGGPPIKNALADLAGACLYATGALPVTDATNTFLAVRRAVWQSLQPLDSTGFAWGLELRLRAFSAGYRLVSVPTVWRDRSAGRSKFPWRRLPEYAHLAVGALIRRVTGRVLP
jgi:glycosyltransferase involved in cell wall biosynthesis